MLNMPKIKLSLFGTWKVYEKNPYIVEGTLDEFVSWYFNKVKELG
jgi:hypothetical protein